jgi:S-adenosylmethionine:tRNA ribosyltransferase-isomerase
MSLNINEFIYNLPQERIAQYPLAERDQSKLLVYDKGKIRHETFRSLPEFLPGNATLFFNDTKVIPARILFQKETGAMIEVFLLHPVKPSSMMLHTMQATGRCAWKCVIGNLKRWPPGSSLTKKLDTINLSASLLSRDENVVEFSWDSKHNFAQILEFIGKTPLPPYLKRDVEEGDKTRYQTVYSSIEGAVAAPTAGLHFTERVFESLRQKGITKDFLTLHVSAGTFQPIKVSNVLDHTMHQEQMVVSRKNVENMLRSRFTIAVGTTSLRTLESVYWFGVKLLKDPETEFVIDQQDPYTQHDLPSYEESLHAIIDHMDRLHISTVTGETSIYIVPGYIFRSCQALITNFHQPGSTLMLLVAAFIGSDWKKIYEEAIKHDYRFLSYGDSSLLIP